MRMRGDTSPDADAFERVIGKFVTKHFGQGAQDRPIFARFAGRERCTARHLHAAFSIDVDCRFFRIGRARQHDVSAMRATVSMRTDVDDETAGLNVDLVDPEQEQHIERAGLASGGIQRALSRHKADVERADHAASLCRHEKPFQPSLTTPSSAAAFAAIASTAAPSWRQRALPDV